MLVIKYLGSYKLGIIIYFSGNSSLVYYIKLYIVLWFTNLCTFFERCFRSDVIFFVLDSVTGDVIHPDVVLQ